VRHLILVSKTLFETTFGANDDLRRQKEARAPFSMTIRRNRVAPPGGPLRLAGAARLGAVVSRGTGRRGLVEELAGVNCSPIAVKGTKLRHAGILE